MSRLMATSVVLVCSYDVRASIINMMKQMRKEVVDDLPSATFDAAMVVSELSQQQKSAKRCSLTDGPYCFTLDSQSSFSNVFLTTESFSILRDVPEKDNVATS